MTTTITRADLENIKGITPKLVRFFVDLFSDNQATAQIASDAADTAAGAVGATGAIQNATVLTLSPNAAFNNERVLVAGAGVTLTDTGANGTLTIAVSVTDRITVVGNFDLTLRIAADTDLTLPQFGIVATLDLGNAYVDDDDAAGGDVLVGQMYKKTNGTIAWRQA